MKVTVDGVELTLEQRSKSVTVKRVVARDRVRKINVTSGVTFSLADHVDGEVSKLIRVIRRVVNLATATCRCDYRYGFSDHAEHCQSLHVATEYLNHDD